ncbi:MAG: Stp1/IreP family PP2C-type Ser/Thr phosphatase [Firmicutes bacterium]|nr:Stp1/IreP family PP2C-type Ser/Thr phosphatase [Clostridiales bacterium]MBQ4339960.1 Stp1/IreP family PP2C-type Ser/Thr phosphatase [Bacillota bacterium]
MDIGFITDTGRRRDNNEDCFFTDKDNKIFIVADGVGGQNAGEIASSIAVKEISDYLKSNLDNTKTGGKYIFGCISEGINTANEKILEESFEKESFSKMATTAVVLMIRNDIAYIANVGDSRAYLLRDGKLIRLTEDHTMANQLIREGKLTEEEVEFLAQKQLALNMFSTITRALGDKNGVESDNFFVDIEEDDVFLLCTDGLYGEVTDEKMSDIIVNEPDAQKACEKLVEEANENGGRDNITAIIIKIGDMNHE